MEGDALHEICYRAAKAAQDQGHFEMANLFVNFYKAKKAERHSDQELRKIFQIH